MMRGMRFMVALGLLASVRSGWADDAFFHVPWSELELLEGALPSPDEGTWRNWQLRTSEATLRGPRWRRGSLRAVRPRRSQA